MVPVIEKTTSVEETHVQSAQTFVSPTSFVVSSSESQTDLSFIPDLNRHLFYYYDSLLRFLSGYNKYQSQAAPVPVQETVFVPVQHQPVQVQQPVPVQQPVRYVSNASTQTVQEVSCQTMTREESFLPADSRLIQLKVTYVLFLLFTRDNRHRNFLYLEIIDTVT